MAAYKSKTESLIIKPVQVAWEEDRIRMMAFKAHMIYSEGGALVFKLVDLLSIEQIELELATEDCQ